MRNPQWIVSVFPLLLLIAGSANGVEQQKLQEQRNAEYMQLLDDLERTLLNGEAKADTKNITPGCVEVPLSTNPTGPTWSFDIEGFDDRAEATVWRVPCSQDDAVVLITFEPIVGETFICSTNFLVIQDNKQFDNVGLKQDPEGSGFCDDLFVTTTVAVDQNRFDDNWDDDAAFTLIHNRDDKPRVDVGRYKASDYNLGGGGGPIEINGSLSGSWFDRSRNGEGFIFEVGESNSGPIFSAYWFTYKEGRQYWLIGVEPLSPGQTEVTMDLLEFGGTGFGANFDPSEVTNRTWGELTLSFESCDSGTAEYSSSVGMGSGSFDLERITLGLEGVDCPQ